MCLLNDDVTVRQIEVRFPAKTNQLQNQITLQYLQHKNCNGNNGKAPFNSIMYLKKKLLWCTHIYLLFNQRQLKLLRYVSPEGNLVTVAVGVITLAAVTASKIPTELKKLSQAILTFTLLTYLFPILWMGVL